MKGIQSNGFLPIIAQAIAEMEELHGEFASIRSENQHLISLQRFSIVVHSNVLLCHSLVLSDRMGQRAKQ